MAERATTPREWAIAIGGGLALAAVLVTVLRGSGPEVTVPPAPEAPAVEMISAPAPVSAPAPAPASAPAALPPPAPARDGRASHLGSSAPLAIPPPPEPIATAAMPTALATGGMTLRGLMVRPGAAASAIIEMSDGRQRLVRAGSGLGNDQRVESIDAGGVVISGPGGQQMLAMPDSPARAGSATASRAFSAPLTALAATANDYRLAMKPRKAGGQTTGFIVTDVARLPALRMAGMMPGDVLISVNGSGIISEEKLMEMPAEIAGAYAVDVVFERAGQQRRAVVKIER